MSIVGFAGDVGYVAVPAAVALETIGVPVPAETTLVAAAVLAAQGRLNVAIVISLTRWRPRVRAPRLGTRRQVIAVLGLGAATTGFVVFVLPEIAGAGAAWRRVRQGDPAWLFAAGLAEILSYAGYVALLRIVFRGTVRWRESFLITMAGVAATRLLATAGAGGIALTSWALRRLGLPAQAVAQGQVGFMVVLYAVYMAALLVLGVGIGTGVLAGGGSPLLTLLPATLAAGLIALALTMARAPGRIEQRLASLAAGEGRRRGRAVRNRAGLAASGDAARRGSHGGASTSRRWLRDSTPSAPHRR